MSNPYNIPEELIFWADGGPFRPGVNNFNWENLCSALYLGKIAKRSGVTIKTDVRVWDALMRNHLMCELGGRYYYPTREFEIVVDEENSYLERDKCYSLITSPCGKQVCLVTRES